MVVIKMVNIKKYSLIFLIGLVLVVHLVSAYGASNVRVTLVNQDPDPVQQGNVVEVKFRIENLGSETLNDVGVEIMPKYPFKLYSGSASTVIGKLRSSETGGDATVLAYKLRVDRNAVKGDNEIEMRVRVGNGMWINYVKNEFLIRVSDLNTSDLKLYLRDSTITKANTRGKITLGLANTNNGDASFVQMTLLPSEDYEILSPSNYFYIGDMEADDTESQDVELFMKGSGKDKVILPVRLEYKDPDGLKYKKDVKVELRLYDSSELKKFGFEKTSSMAYMSIILLAILGILVYWYKRRKKK